MGELAKSLAEKYPYGLVGTIARSNGVGDFISKLLNTPDPGLQVQGLVLNNPRNIQLLHSLVQQGLGDRTEPTILGPARVADAFIKAKYPKIYNLVKSTEYPLSLDTELGSYAPTFNRAFIGQAYRGVERPIGALVNTIGHELTHAVQNTRGKLPKAVIDAVKDFQGYWNQPHEILARQGGKTAQTAWGKFLDYVRELGLQ